MLLEKYLKVSVFVGEGQLLKRKQAGQNPVLVNALRNSIPKYWQLLQLIVSNSFLENCVLTYAVVAFTHLSVLYSGAST